MIEAAYQEQSIHDTAPVRESLNPEMLNTLFAQFNPSDIEQFYTSYQSWILQQQRVVLLTKFTALQQKIAKNAEQMQQIAPSALALASLTQLQACGVHDIDLLDRMLERGEVWLDHTIQLLTRCEQLHVIGDNYSEWCEHALEGAYDWINSIDEGHDEAHATLAEIANDHIHIAELYGVQATEELILQKLKSDEEEVDLQPSTGAISHVQETQELGTEEPADATNLAEEVVKASNNFLRKAILSLQGYLRRLLANIWRK